MMANDNPKKPLIVALRKAVRQLDAMEALDDYKAILVLVDPNEVGGKIKVGIASDSNLTNEEADEMKKTLEDWLQVVVKKNAPSMSGEALDELKEAVKKILRKRAGWSHE